jgi:hypothetical protein
VEAAKPVNIAAAVIPAIAVIMEITIYCIVLLPIFINL